VQAAQAGNAQAGLILNENPHKSTELLIECKNPLSVNGKGFFAGAASRQKF